MNNGLVIVIAGVAGASLLIAAVAYFWLNRTPSVSRRDDDEGGLPLFGSDLQVVVNSGAVAPEPPPPPPPARPSFAPPPRPVPVAPPAGGPVSRPVIREFVTAPTPPRPQDAVSPAAASPAVVPQPAVDGAAVAAEAVPGTMVEGHLLRFSVPVDGTLQFLPGRLEVTAGQDAGREIRFVRLAGPDGNIVTFGRSEGPPYRHIQLREQTVSRSHARMRFAEGSWHLTNLSGTNPVVLNGLVLGDGEERSLQDGDRIEMGEVTFGFRS